MKALLISMTLMMVSCAGTQTLKGYNHAQPKPTPEGVVEPEAKSVNPWIVWGISVVAISGLAWYMFKKESPRN